MDSCKNWLKNLLSCGMSEYRGVKASAVEAGYTKGMLREARKELGVKTWHQVDTDANPRIDNWFWYLPEDEQA